MNNYYLYRFVYQKKNKQGAIFPCSATVIYCPNPSIDLTNLQTEIRCFYETHHHTDEIYVLSGKFCEGAILEVFIKNRDEVFKYLFKSDKNFLDENLFLCSYDVQGKLTSLNGRPQIKPEILDQLINVGLQEIFIKRGGLVESTGAHHFVFPSGKHCNKFLRTGNILLHSSEIYFIAFTLLEQLSATEHNQIYCDTSSINTIAFALLDLKRRLAENSDYDSISVQSFSSYSGLQESKGGYFKKALILISASTSANILDKITQANPLARKKNMVILFYHGKESVFIENRDHILCNLTKDKVNINGLEHYETFSLDNCLHCKSGSYAVNVIGDVFLLEKPKVNQLTLRLKDSPKDLSEFLHEFMAPKGKKILKASYKEIATEASQKYEVYFDMKCLLGSIEENKDSKFDKKLDYFIDHYIPSNTKYLVCLNDKASKMLGMLILERVNDKKITLITQEEIDRIKEDDKGAVVIVASCVSNGKNLLYLSRSLRRCENLTLVYFIALARTRNEEQLSFLKSNLKQGIYGAETNSFITVYDFFMDNTSNNTTWINEIAFLKTIKEFTETLDRDCNDVTEIINGRIRYLEVGMNDINCGLTDNLFYKNFFNGEDLRLRKNFAFFKFHEYEDLVCQSEVYFTVSTVINNLRNSKDLSRCLRQTEYVRNIIEPGNFSRFNDGVIQASILRAADKQELAYHLEYDISKSMFDLISTMIQKHDTQQGEALFEFIYALATQKLTLKTDHVALITQMIDNTITHSLYRVFNDYIKLNAGINITK